MIADNGLLSGGMASSAFDGEGVPSQKTVLIKDGILKGFLYDSYAAEKRTSSPPAMRLDPGTPMFPG